MNKYLAASFLIVTGLASIGSHATAAVSTDASSHWTYSGGFRDEATGRSYYEARDITHYPGDFLVIYGSSDGQWYSLPKSYESIWQSREGEDGIFLGTGLMVEDNVWSTLQYDPARDVVLQKIDYESSPDGKWGLHIAEHYTREATSGKQLLALIKDKESGKVRKLAFTAFYSGIRWMPDSRLLANVYSESAKQNIILAIDPHTGQTVKLLDATLLTYGSKSGKLLIAYNEPARKQWVYDLASKSVHAATLKESEQLYAEARASYPAPGAPVDPGSPAEVPSGLQPDKLPLIPLAAELRSEAEADINGRTVGLPYAFLEGSKAWIPVQPLLAGFDLRAVRTTSGEYEIESGDSSVQLPASSIRMYGGHLFLTTGQLAHLGLKVEKLDWLPSSEQ